MVLFFFFFFNLTCLNLFIGIRTFKLLLFKVYEDLKVGTFVFTATQQQASFILLACKFQLFKKIFLILIVLDTSLASFKNLHILFMWKRV